MSEFQKKAEGIFARFAEKLSKVDLKLAVSIPAVIGATVAVAGCALEAHGELGVLKHGGIAAVNAYKDTLVQYPFGEFLRRGLEGKLPSFGGNTQARGFAFMVAAPIVSAASVSLARGFTGLKKMLAERGERLREDARESLHSQDRLDDSGRYEWAHARAADTTEGSWREPPPVDRAIPDRIGTVEMLRRLALAHRVKVDDLVLESGEVRLYGGAENPSRPICKVGSPFWVETERNAMVLHRFAQEHRLDPSQLYIREDVVYEENKEAFIDRTVCKIGSKEWEIAQREQLSHELDKLFDVKSPAATANVEPHAANDEQPRARFRPA
ncbi:hypothetical protein BVER_01761c [Candidatus Burkholderia verschuerenii]|uniref:Uncharacterized protein n=1 Tax=Candidatus Burkholderia verschuerenii TaxID=242163 RepID=A0A0L0MJ06_9BURK|nr:hypothetical protein [Candidatus Burkholderia verschuerenii]KND62300.1 hypothetical protein BVER_01761c [Candidatus Burkholderia verschuerenii]